MRTLVFLCLLVSFFVGRGQDQWNEVFHQTFSRQHYETASMSCSVYNLASKKMLFNENPNLLLIPASTLKIVSTGAALDLLGNQFRFHTRIFYTGEIRQATLFGNIIIKGMGDPTFCSPKWDEPYQSASIFRQILTSIKQKGIESILGKIIVDVSFYDSAGHPPTWLWKDLGNYYAAGNWALNFNENEYKLSFQQNAIPGQKTKIHQIDPIIPDFQLINEVVSGKKGTGDNAYIFSSEFSKGAYVRGSIPPGNGIFSIRGSLPNPPLAFALALKNFLQDNEINVEVECELSHEAQLEDEKPLISFESPDLIEIINRANQESVNLYCESLLDYLGKWNEKQENKLDFIHSYWEEKGVDMKDAVIKDGSGLSTKNAMSSRIFIDMLASIYNQKHFSDFKSSLSEGGVNGTGLRLFKTSILKSKVWLKSGSMERVCCYVGYLYTKSGDMLAFSIMVNNARLSNSQIRKDIRAFLEFVYQEN